MKDTLPDNVPDLRLPGYPEPSAPLPPWLVSRLLRPGETVTWVLGPRFNPPWERYVTHWALALVALALGVVCLGAGRSLVGEWSRLPPLAGLAAGAIVLGAIFLLGVANGYFTRLVVTDSRLLILQGHEVCRNWSIDDLPTALLHHGMQAGGISRPTVDLDALRTMLGTASEKFSEAKTILAFGKQLDRITTTRTDDRHIS